MRANTTTMVERALKALTLGDLYALGRVLGIKDPENARTRLDLEYALIAHRKRTELREGIVALITERMKAEEP